MSKYAGFSDTQVDDHLKNVLVGLLKLSDEALAARNLSRFALNCRLRTFQEHTSAARCPCVECKAASA